MSMMLNSYAFAAAAAWNPASLFASGEKGFIFDPTNPANMDPFSNNTSPPIASSGDAVGRIKDLSGNANDATQVNSGARALWDINGSVKSLAFNGITNSRFYSFASGMLTGWASGHFLYAAKLNNDPVSVERRGGPPLGQSGSDTASDHYPYTDGVVYHGVLSTARKTCGNPTPSMASWHQGDFRSASGAWGFAINGTDVFTTATNTFAGRTGGSTSGPLIGSHQANRGDGGLFLDGYLSRMILINRVLTGTELTNARAWIAASY